MAESHTAGHKVVNSLADPGNGVCNATQCTLREAINDPASTEISFAQGLSGPITLATPAAGGGTLVIQKTLAITGPGAGIVLRRRNTDPAFRIVRIVPDVTVRLANLTIRGGKTDRPGGGILNFGTLTLTNCTIAGNVASHGGGIDNHAPLTLTHSTVANNSAGRGAGIDNHPNGRATVSNSTIEGNTGGGISNTGGALEVVNSAIVENSGGGGISQTLQTARSTLDKVRIVGNSNGFRGGGIGHSSGTITLRNSTIAGNSAPDGGGIFNISGIFTITNSTVVNNSATSQGGGIVSRGFFRIGARLTLTNSTVSGNSAGFSGGGIFVSSGSEADSDVFVVNSTVAFNSASTMGGGIQVTSFSRVGLTNSLVARNSAPTGPDVSADDPDIAHAGFSLIGDGTGSGIPNGNSNQVGNASEPIDPRLGPLADNGGPTRTHALLLGSPAIDAASTPACPLTDQRGVLRPQGTACDIGSYERK